MTLPKPADLVIRNAYVVTMDPVIGDIHDGSVHVRDGVIAAVGPARLGVPGVETLDGTGMIVMPGFVEAHIHLWNAILRNMLRSGLEYFPLKYALSAFFAPRDVYRSNRLALAEAINGGITTVHNFSHNVRTPAHADAELQALAESGLRGRYSYGWIDSMPNDQIMSAEDVVRVQRDWFGSSSPFAGRVDLGVAVRGPMYTPQEVYSAEFRTARALGLPVTLHVGQNRRRTISIARLRDEGFLDRKTLLVHGLLADAHDREAIASAGASVSLCPYSELRNQEDGVDGDLRSQMLQMLAAGINVCLSIDAHAVAPMSMFDTMSLAWHIGIPWNGTPTEGLPRLNFRQCIEMVTINAARALGITDRTGSLTPGKRADLLAIRATDLNMVPAAEVDCAIVRSATIANVDTVIADGRVLKRNGQLQGIDMKVVAREAAEALFDVRRRAGGQWTPATPAPAVF